MKIKVKIYPKSFQYFRPVISAYRRGVKRSLFLRPVLTKVLRIMVQFSKFVSTHFKSFQDSFKLLKHWVTKRN